MFRLSSPSASVPNSGVVLSELSSRYFWNRRRPLSIPEIKQGKANSQGHLAGRHKAWSQFIDIEDHANLLEEYLSRMYRGRLQEILIMSCIVLPELCRSACLPMFDPTGNNSETTIGTNQLVLEPDRCAFMERLVVDTETIVFSSLRQPAYSIEYDRLQNSRMECKNV